MGLSIVPPARLPDPPRPMAEGRTRGAKRTSEEPPLATDRRCFGRTGSSLLARHPRAVEPSARDAAFASKEALMRTSILRTCALAATLLIVFGAQRDGHAQKNLAPARAAVAAHAVRLPSRPGISVQHLLKKRRGADFGDARMSPMGQLAYLASTGQLQDLIDEAQTAPGRGLQVI